MPKCSELQCCYFVLPGLSCPAVTKGMLSTGECHPKHFREGEEEANFCFSETNCQEGKL